MGIWSESDEHKPNMLQNKTRLFRMRNVLELNRKIQHYLAREQTVLATHLETEVHQPRIQHDCRNWW